MDKLGAQIATICGCIDHCFSFAMWCEDFVPYLDPEDMMSGLDRAAELQSEAAMLQSFLALRKLGDFLGGGKVFKGDLTAVGLGVEAAAVLAEVGGTLLEAEERTKIDKQVAHLTEQLSLEADDEVDLHVILRRSLPGLVKLVSELREIDANGEAAYWLDRTDGLIERVKKIKSQEEKFAADHADSAK